MFFSKPWELVKVGELGSDSMSLSFGVINLAGARGAELLWFDPLEAGNGNFWECDCENLGEALPECWALCRQLCPALSHVTRRQALPTDLSHRQGKWASPLVKLQVRQQVRKGKFELRSVGFQRPQRKVFNSTPPLFLSSLGEVREVSLPWQCKERWHQANPKGEDLTVNELGVAFLKTWDRKRFSFHLHFSMGLPVLLPGLTSLIFLLPWWKTKLGYYRAH